MPARKTGWTLERYLTMVDEPPWTDLVDRTLRKKEPGSWVRSRARTNLMMLMHQAPELNGGDVYLSLTYIFAADQLPNARTLDNSFGWDIKAMVNEDDYPVGAPEFAAEVLNWADHDRAAPQETLEFMRAHGTKCTFFVDPIQHTVEVVDGDRAWTAGIDDTITLASLNGFSFAVRQLFED